jgi:F0F1-type ATP synthase assembly protein I
MKSEKNFLYYISLISQIGLVVVISCLSGLFVGIFLDNRLNTKGILTIIFLLIGLGGGITGAYKLIFPINKDAKRNKRNNN